jgi:hypothetical protein
MLAGKKIGCHKAFHFFDPHLFASPAFMTNVSTPEGWKASGR